MANAIAVNSAITVGPQQFQGLFSEIWKVKFTVTQDVAVALNDTGVITMTVPGVALGDMIVCKAINMDSNDGTDQAVITFEVSAANTVTMYIHADLGEFAANAINGAIGKIVIGRPAW